MQKTVLILTSGGFDSTYLMIKNLEAGNIVQPLYINIDIDSNQKKNEKKALQTILRFLSFKFSKDQLRELNECEVGTSYASELTLNQPPIWIWGAHRYIHNRDYSKRYFDEIQIAYIMEDHALSFLPEIKQLYSVLNKFVFVKYDTRFPKLKFPIIKLNKSVTFDYIAAYYPEIFNSIWFCETPSTLTQPCGSCHSCKVANDWNYIGYQAAAERNLATSGREPFKLNSEKIFSDLVPDEVEYKSFEEKMLNYEQETNSDEIGDDIPF
jgi:7-cyano-7-deazaguanine synthase in queuosine biosynthesis